MNSEVWDTPGNEFMKHNYPDGKGPDADLIRMLEKDVIDKNP